MYGSTAYFSMCIFIIQMSVFLRLLQLVNYSLPGLYINNYANKVLKNVLMTHSLSSHLEGARSSFTSASLKVLLPWASVFGHGLAVPGSCPGAVWDRAIACAARQIVV